MEDVVAKAEPEHAEVLWSWVNEFPYQQGLELLDSVTSTLQKFNGSEQQIEAAQTVSATAYQRRLDELLTSAERGGRA